MGQCFCCLRWAGAGSETTAACGWCGLLQFIDWVRLIYEDVKLLRVLSTESNQCCAAEPTATQWRLQKKGLKFSRCIATEWLCLLHSYYLITLVDVFFFLGVFLYSNSVIEIKTVCCGIDHTTHLGDITWASIYIIYAATVTWHHFGNQEKNQLERSVPWGRGRRDQHHKWKIHTHAHTDRWKSQRRESKKQEAILTSWF